MKMKRTLALVLTIAICATMALGGTLAFLTDTERQTNVLTVGSVEIVQNEQERGEEGLQDFTQNQSLVPAVYPETTTKEPVDVNGYTINIRDNVKNYVDKIVSVTNTGIVDAYVRTIIAIPSSPNEANNQAFDNWLHWNGVSDTDTDPNNGWIWGADQVNEWPGNNPGWDRVDNVTIGGREYDLVIATNKNAIKPGESTAPSLVGFYLDERVDAERLPDGTLNHFIIRDGVKENLGDLTSLKIYVATQAVQADGFDDAWTALDKAFGDLTADNHPWILSGETAQTLTYTSGEHDVFANIVLDYNGTETDCVVAEGENTVVNIMGGKYDAGNKDTAVWAHGGATVNIYDGHFLCKGIGDDLSSSNHQDLIYAGATAQNTEGYINIYGGTFEAGSDTWLLNESDGRGHITVYGGTFLNFNPADNKAEGEGTSFLAEGYKVVETKAENGVDTWYTVVPGK